MLPHLKAKYVDRGRVRFVFREFPISGPWSTDGFLAARCAGRDRYFATLDAIYRAKPPVDEEDPEGVVIARLAQIAPLTPERLSHCLSDRAAIAALMVRKSAWVDFKRLDVAPTFEINGRRIQGIITVRQLDDAIDRAFRANR